MIAGLERCTYPPMAVLAAVVALTAAILALFPGVAEAQEQQQGAVAPAHSRVVAPGDSLWSISQERLGPSASPQQIALDVRRIHEINRNRVGDDPDLIFPGQRLALPPPPAGAPAGREALANRPSAPTAGRTAAEAAGGAPEQAARPSSERAAEPIAPPALPEGGAVPEAWSLSSRAVPGGGLDVPDVERRRLLGLGILALTLLLAGLMAWRLPMRRDVGDAEAWGLHPVIYHYHGGDRRYQHHDRQEDADPLVEDKPRPGPVPTTGPVNRHEPGRNGAAAAGTPLKGLAVAHNPWVRRALRHAPRGAPTPGRRPPRAEGGTGNSW